jgi:hypothetical protein
LLLDHFVKDGHDPVLELAVVVVRHQEVADSVQALLSKVAACKRKVTSEISISNFDGIGKILVI